MGRTLLNTLRLPPHIKYSVPLRACVILEAMQPSREEAPTASARCSTSTCVAGEIVAQLIKTVPLASLSRESPRFEKMERMAASSVTTVRTTSLAAVTSARVLVAWQLSSLANAVARRGLASCTALIVNRLSTRLRAILAPIRPKPTTPIRTSFFLAADFLFAILDLLGYW